MRLAAEVCAQGAEKRIRKKGEGQRAEGGAHLLHASLCQHLCTLEGPLWVASVLSVVCSGSPRASQLRTQPT